MQWYFLEKEVKWGGRIACGDDEEREGKRAATDASQKKAGEIILEPPQFLD